jgi:hypothetical protein
MRTYEFPSNSLGKIFRNDDLPEHLKPHGCILAIAPRRKIPQLKINSSSHTIVHMVNSASPAGGSSALQIAADCVERGGDAFLPLEMSTPL